MTPTAYRIAATVTLLATLCSAQPPVKFEAASIRRNLSGSMNTQISTSGGRLTITNASLKTLIRNAYDILGFQVTGGPGWLDSDMYDISATTGEPGKMSPETFRLALKALLADRFSLKVHEETREASAYILLPAKSGPKLVANSTGVEPGINTSKGLGRARMKGAREPIAVLASNLANQTGRYVIDRTGLTGFWDWTLEWDPDPNADSQLPSLFTALQEQLGLRLEGQKGPVPMLVIDSVEKPSDN